MYPPFWASWFKKGPSSLILSPPPAHARLCCQGSDVRHTAKAGGTGSSIISHLWELSLSIYVVPSAGSFPCCFLPRSGTQASLARLGAQVPFVLFPWTYYVTISPWGHSVFPLLHRPTGHPQTPAWGISFFLNLRKTPSVFPEPLKPLCLLPQTHP